MYGMKSGSHLFVCRYPIVLKPFVEKIIFSPINFLHIWQNKLKIYFWTLNCVSFICISILMSVPHYPDNCIFIVSSEIEKWKSSNLSFKMILAIIGVLHFHINFRVCLSIYAKKSTQNFDRDCIKSTAQSVENFHLNNIESSNPQTWNALPFT